MFPFRLSLASILWRGVRVAEGARLESVCTLTRTEGSNPSLSAIKADISLKMADQGSTKLRAHSAKHCESFWTCAARP
jgi:hypothetical protein